MPEKTLFDQVVEFYACNKYDSSKVSIEEFRNILEAVKCKALKDAIPLIEKDELERLKNRVDEDAKAYKRKVFQKLQRTLIVEAIFIAFFVGIVVNQITSLIPGVLYWCLGAIILSIAACILLIILGTTDSKE